MGKLLAQDYETGDWVEVDGVNRLILQRLDRVIELLEKAELGSTRNYHYHADNHDDVRQSLRSIAALAGTGAE